MTVDDLIDFTPELRAEAIKVASRYKMGPIFTPAVVSKFEGPLGTLMLPSAGGGVNWPGGSADPETGILYIYSVTTVTPLGLINDPKRSDMDYIRGVAPDPKAAQPAGEGGGGDEGGGTVTVQGLPLIKPPYARITAIDLNRGEIVWQIPHGETPDNIRNHPALKGVNIPHGTPGTHRNAEHEEPGRRGRGRFLHAPRPPARRHAARLRQGNRKRSGRGLHARAANPGRR